MLSTVEPTLPNSAPAAKGLRALQEHDRLLSAVAARLWRFPALSVEQLGHRHLRTEEAAGLDRDPVIQPETASERRAGVARQIFRPVAGLENTDPMNDAATSLNRSALEVEAETPAEAAFLDKWNRKYGR